MLGHYAKQQSGFTLLEVLIAIMILSIGLLGLAGLQTSSLQYTHDSYSRSLANVYMQQVLDTLAMNTINHSRPQSVKAVIAAYTVPASKKDCVPDAVGVTAELQCWYANIRNNLPNGAATIQNIGNSAVLVTITWHERGARNYSTDTNTGSGSEAAFLQAGQRQLAMQVAL